MTKYNIAISLGCTNTRILKSGVGVVLNEPTLLLIDPKDRKNPIRAVGDEAVKLSVNKPELQLVCPMKNGVIANKDFAKKLLIKFLEKLNEKKFFRGNLLWLTPTSLSQTDKNEFVNLGYSLGYKNVDTVQSALASFQELEIDNDNKRAHMLIDLGGDSTDISIVLRGRIIQGCTVDLGGRTLDLEIEDYLRSVFQMNVPEMYASKIKKQVNSMLPNDQLGCDITILDENGLSNELSISARELREIYVGFFLKICDLANKVLSMCTNDIIGDIGKTGIYLTGGLANITGLDKFLKSRLGLPVYVAERPEYTSIFGAEKLVNEPEKLEKLMAMN